MKKISCYCVLLSCLTVCSSWGFFAHQQINRMAIFTLPQNMSRFYKANLSYITAHAVDPDKRRYADTGEAVKHFLDADRYGTSPFDSLPPQWNAAVAKYSEKTLRENGILPWQIQRSYFALVRAFQQKDSSAILKRSSDLGHYIGDAHVPLHTTENYNGQLTDQIGIHAFWESRLPELFAKNYNFLTGRATYIEDPLAEAWRIIRHTYQLKDSVLRVESNLTKGFGSDYKYDFSARNGIIIRQYSEGYSKAYHLALQGMVESQMRASVIAVGSFWYSAWVDAGQPDLKNLRRSALTDQDRKQIQKEEKLFKGGKILGREEN